MIKDIRKAYSLIPTVNIVFLIKDIFNNFLDISV